MTNKKTEFNQKTTQMIDTKQFTNSLENKLAARLTERGFTFTVAQVKYVANSTHDLLPKGKTFNQSMSGSMYMAEMVSNFIDFSNLSKWESDFNNL